MTTVLALVLLVSSSLLLGGGFRLAAIHREADGRPFALNLAMIGLALDGIWDAIVESDDHGWYYLLPHIGFVWAGLRWAYKFNKDGA